MKYKALIDNVNKYQYKNEFTYFRTIAQLQNLREDLSTINVMQHLLGIIKPYLIKWGRMGRVVGREGLHWETLGTILRSLENEFAELRHQRFRTINFDEPAVSDAITRIYGKLDPLLYLGSPTTISKVLHLLNPEIFVMWDKGIRARYKQRNYRIQDNAEGYLQFLKETQQELREAFADRQVKNGKSYDAIEDEIRKKFDNKTLAKIIDQYNYGLVHPFRQITEKSRGYDQKEIHVEDKIPNHISYLMTIRHLLEKELRRIYEARTQDQGERFISSTGIAKLLVGIGLLDKKTFKMYRDVYSICSTAVHAKDVSPAQIRFVKDVAPGLINLLRLI